VFGPTNQRVFLFGGLDVARDSAFLWSGRVSAPLGWLDENGVRLRLFAGQGIYRYKPASFLGGWNAGAIETGELLVGYRIGSDSTALTAYVGGHFEYHYLLFADPANVSPGARYGPKVLVEIYSRFRQGIVVTVAASASAVHRSFSLRSTFAFQLGISQIGAEGAIFGNQRYTEVRAGLLARIPLGRIEIALTGGLLSNSGSRDGFYSTLLLYVPY
jgi:hypothetical protein